MTASAARLRPHLPLALVFAAAAAVLGVLSSRVRDWVVMTDELQYAKLATHIGQTLSPLPVLRGERVSIFSQLYPLLISPFYGTMTPPHAFVAAHVVNALVFASATVPVYLLARQVELARLWAAVCAALAVAVPWNVETAFVMTESTAYAAFAWAMLAFVRALAAPSPRRDAVALVALGFAVLARTQFFVLAPALVVAALVLRRRDVWRAHRVLLVAVAAFGVVALLLRGSLLGNYSVTATEGWPLPLRAFPSAAEHLGLVGVGIGLLPLVVGGAWLVVRRTPFSVLAVTSIVLLCFEAASYDVRFGGGPVPVRDRYVFYLAPLLLVAFFAALRDGVGNRTLAALAAFTAGAVLLHDFAPFAGVHVDAPTVVLNDVIDGAGGRAFVGLLVVVLALAFALVPRARRIGSVLVVAVVCVGASATAWDKLLTSRSSSSRPVTGVRGLVLDWADGVVPDGGELAMLPYAANGFWGPNALLWWDVELWNDVTRSYAIGDTWDYAPFPHTQLRVDAQDGVVKTDNEAPYVIVDSADARLRLAGTVLGSSYGLDVLKPDLPYRALWITEGLDPDGWSRPGRPASIHSFDTVPLRVTFQKADGSTEIVCRIGDIAVPGAPTGTVPELPLDPAQPATRTVGVRVARIEWNVCAPDA
jgi:hypothetical protein